MGINTGTGGVEIDGKLYSFATGDPSDQTAELTDVQPSKGDINVDTTKKDISKGTRTTLGKYLKSLTSTNTYPVPSEPVDVSLTTEKNIPSPLSQPVAGQFASDIPEVQLKNNPSVKLLDGLSKGKQNLKQPTSESTDGNTLLPSVTSKTQPAVLSEYTNTVLANNRFSALNAMAPTVKYSDSSNTPADFNPVLRHPKYGDISAGRLAQVGVALSLRASQELSAGERGNNPTGGDQEAAALLPTPNQFGIGKINSLVLQARDVLDGLTNEEIPKATYQSISNDSWGNLNNIDDPFSGASALGMIALSMAMTASVTLLFEGMGFLLSLIKGGSNWCSKEHQRSLYSWQT
jgi:hypothetical protein